VDDELELTPIIKFIKDPEMKAMLFEQGGIGKKKKIGMDDRQVEVGRADQIPIRRKERRQTELNDRIRRKYTVGKKVG
jgi:hypothetical protein